MTVPPLLPGTRARLFVGAEGEAFANGTAPVERPVREWDLQSNIILCFVCVWLTFPFFPFEKGEIMDFLKNLFLVSTFGTPKTRLVPLERRGVIFD